MPKEVVNDQSSTAENISRFIVEPLERGYGVTLGNSLRRVLLSSIQGAAVTAIRIKGALHEFATIPGVYEDVTHIVLNVKSIIVRFHARRNEDRPSASAKSIGKLTAGMIEADPDVEILNPEQPICELTDNIDFEMELDIEPGRGYNIAEMNKRPDAPVNSVFVDSLFSPVTKVSYFVENTRVGQKTDYDRLILEIHTNGTITPEDALSYGAKLLKDHLQLFIHLDEQVMVEETAGTRMKRSCAFATCSGPGSMNWNFPSVRPTVCVPPTFRPWPNWSPSPKLRCSNIAISAANRSTRSAPCLNR